jgi:hypothetical protein
MSTFNWQVYKELNPELVKAGLNSESQITMYWNKYGYEEKGKNKITDVYPDFNWEKYKDLNLDLQLETPLDYELHWITTGIKEKRLFKLEELKEPIKEENIIILKENEPKQIKKSVGKRIETPTTKLKPIPQYKSDETIKLPEIPKPIDTVKKYSALENLLIKYDYNKIADLMKHVRLSNPHKNPIKHRMWFEQCQYNIPLLIFASIQLNNICCKNKFKRLLFSTRDCCLWIKIFNQMYKGVKTVYFHTSRNIYYNPTDDYIKYIKDLYNANSIIIDLHATGKSLSYFFDKHTDTIPDVFFLYYIKAKNRDDIPKNINVQCIYTHGSPGALDGRHARIEVLNYDIIGTLVSYKNNKPIRDPIEYNKENVEEGYHKCIDFCCKIMDEYKIDNDTINMELIRQINATMNKNKACGNIG